MPSTVSRDRSLPRDSFSTSFSHSDFDGLSVTGAALEGNCPHPNPSRSEDEALFHAKARRHEDGNCHSLRAFVASCEIQFSYCPFGLSMISVRTPPMSLGWTKKTSVPCAPMRGSPSTRAPLASNSDLAAWISGTSKQTWCWPPKGFFSRNFRMGELSPKGSISSICELG